MKKIWIGAVLAGSLALVGCGGDKPAETAKTEGAAPAGGALTAREAAALIAQAAPLADFRGQRVILIIPDGTRTAPIGPSKAVQHT